MALLYHTTFKLPAAAAATAPPLSLLLPRQLPSPGCSFFVSLSTSFSPLIPHFPSPPPFFSFSFDSSISFHFGIFSCLFFSSLSSVFSSCTLSLFLDFQLKSSLFPPPTFRLSGSFNFHFFICTASFALQAFLGVILSRCLDKCQTMNHHITIISTKYK